MNAAMRLAVWCAGGALLVPVLALSAVGASPTAPEGPVDPTAGCAPAALAPAVRITPRRVPVEGLSPRQVKVAISVAAEGRRLKVPARAQAIALMTALNASGFKDPDSSGRFLFRSSLPATDSTGSAGSRGGMGVRAFYRSLRRVEGWESLPPSLAAHRTVRGADPYRYAESWESAVNLLSILAVGAEPVGDARVASGARAPRRCVTAPDGVGHPLPAGTAYRVRPLGGPGEEAEPATQGTGGIEFLAHCGTPVLSANAGTVILTSDDRAAAGPWRIGVRNDQLKTTTWYSHVQSPQVQDGESVGAGLQLAEVGDLGSADRCLLGLTVRSGEKEQSVDAARWLRRESGRTPQTAPDQPVREYVEIPATAARLATFNVLGSHHSSPGGKNARLQPGPVRMRGALELLEASSVEIVVFNEFESPQADVVLADGDWELHRATGNSRLRRGGYSGNAVAWRGDMWEQVSVDEFTVPWQVTLHMPVVTLRSRATGRQIRVIGVHNPASTRRQGNQQAARDTARAIEREMVRRLVAAPQVPVVLMGDMNERGTVFCDFTRDGLMRAAAGGSSGGVCIPPSFGGVDWIFGAGLLTFDNHVVDRSTLGGISDHPLVTADIRIPAG